MSILDMKPLHPTQKLHQVIDFLEGADPQGTYSLEASELVCSCPGCKLGETCSYINERKIWFHRVKEEENIEDEFGVMTKKVAELRLELKARNLPTNGFKVVLQTCLLQYLKNEQQEEEEGDEILLEEVHCPESGIEQEEEGNETLLEEVPERGIENGQELEDEENNTEDEFGVMAMKVAALNFELKARNLPTNELKVVLQKRLLRFLKNEESE